MQLCEGALGVAFAIIAATSHWCTLFTCIIIHQWWIKLPLQ